jgi:2-phosphoglycerate kinase
MIYLIGGVGRSGKSTLANKILKTHQISNLSTDRLFYSLANSERAELSWGMNHEDMCLKMLPVVQELVSYYPEQDFVIEGQVLLPEYFETINQSAKGMVKMAIMGYGDCKLEDKIQAVKDHPSYNEWLANKPDQDIIDTIKKFMHISTLYKNDCKKFDVPYFDTSKNFDQVIELAMQNLIEPKYPPPTSWVLP